MSASGSNNSGRIISWAVIAGVVAFLILMFAIDYDFWPAVILGLLVGVLVAILLWIGFHRDADEAGPASGAVPQVPEPQEKPAPAKKEKSAEEPTAGGEEEKSASAARKAEPAGKAAGTEAKAEAGPPPALKALRGGKADDLKQIRGVGPKLEKVLNEMGIWHFDQIASWGSAEVAWMDANLKGFRGRVSRDDWVGQARALTGSDSGQGGKG